MKAKTIKQVLKAGKWILDNVGWCQYSYYTDKSGVRHWDTEAGATSGDVGCACALGCIYMVDVENPDLRSDAASFLEKLVGTGNLATWNDQPGRTKEEVSKLFARGIKQAK